MAAPARARPLALVTGASSGIGAAFARRAVADGHDVVLVARRKAALEALAAELRTRGASVLVVATDLTAPDGVARVMAALDARGAVVDVLVNNAGSGRRGGFLDLPEATIEAIVALNAVAATRLLRAVIPGMIARKHGRIVNVASIAAFQPGPNMATYCATKAYLLSLSDALSIELRRRKVTVTTLCPGPVATEFADLADLGNTYLFSGLVGVADADDVARIGWTAMQAGRRLVVPGWRNRLIAVLARILPRPLVMRAVRALLRVRR